MFRKYVDHGVAAAWGAAEATVFFIVPDFWTSWLALHNPRRGFATTLSALAGALAGGATNYVASQRMSRKTQKILTTIPGISKSMITDVERELDEKGLVSSLLGQLAVCHIRFTRTLAHGNESFAKFMALSVPARMGRFLAVTGGVAALGKLADRRGYSHKTKTGLFLGGWAAFTPGTSQQAWPKCKLNTFKYSACVLKVRLQSLPPIGLCALPDS